MKEVVRYILETVVCSGILYGAYLLFLRNCTGYLAARLCLTGSLLAAALIPLLRIPVWPGKVIYATAGTPAKTTFTAPSVSAAAFDYEAAIWIVYGCGVLLLLSSMFRQALLIRRLRRHSTQERIGRIVLVRPTAQIASFSFFRTIYISRSVAEKDIAAIFAHEKSHVIHRHSLEQDHCRRPESPAVVESFRVARSTRTYRSGRVRSRPRRTRRGARHRKLSENHLHAAVRLQSGRSRQSVQFINQFINKKTNPNDDNAYEEQIRSAPPDPVSPSSAACWRRRIHLDGVKSASRTNCRQLTPRPTRQRKPPKKTASPENEDYDLLLVVDGEVTDFKTDPVTGLRSLTLPSGTYSIVGTEDLTPKMREKYAAYLPGKAAVFYKKDTTGKASKVQIRDETAYSQIAVCNATLALEQTEQMPSFQSGDMKAFHNWVNSQIRYPAEAFKNNLGGKVVAQFTVDQAGSVGDIKILQSPDKCFSDEVTRILESSPKWTPGRDEKGDAVKVSLVIPVDFRMTAEKPSKLTGLFTTPAGQESLNWPGIFRSIPLSSSFYQQKRGYGLYRNLFLHQNIDLYQLPKLS